MTPPRQSIVDGRSLAIAVLSVTACVLFVGFMLVSTQSAQAIGMNDQAGDYKMLTQQVDRSTELVVIVDGATERAIIYGFDYSQRRLEIMATIPLDQLPKPPEPVGDQPQRQEPRRRRP